MTVFQVLFIIALVIPIAAVLIYFVSDMLGDLKYIKDVTVAAGEVGGAGAGPGKKTGKKAGKKKRSGQPKQRRAAAERPRPQPEPVRRKTYYHSPEVRDRHDYPQDPFADFKRPDFDTYIRNANERDRWNMDNLSAGDRNRPSGGERKASDGKRRRKKRSRK